MGLVIPNRMVSGPSTPPLAGAAKSKKPYKTSRLPTIGIKMTTYDVEMPTSATAQPLPARRALLFERRKIRLAVVPTIKGNATSISGHTQRPTNARTPETGRATTSHAASRITQMRSFRMAESIGAIVTVKSTPKLHKD
jgi:hypothetical protein